LRKKNHVHNKSKEKGGRKGPKKLRVKKKNRRIAGGITFSPPEGKKGRQFFRAIGQKRGEGEKGRRLPPAAQKGDFKNP